MWKLQKCQKVGDGVSCRRGTHEGRRPRNKDYEENGRGGVVNSEDEGPCEVTVKKVVQKGLDVKDLST